MPSPDRYTIQTATGIAWEDIMGGLANRNLLRAHGIDSGEIECDHPILHVRYVPVSTETDYGVTRVYLIEIWNETDDIRFPVGVRTTEDAAKKTVNELCDVLGLF